MEPIGCQAGSTQEGAGLVVRGVGPSTPWIGFFGSAESNNQQPRLAKNGGNLLVWDTWYETPVSAKDSGPRYIHHTGEGDLTFFNGHIATLPGEEARRNIAAVDLDGFEGNVAISGVAFNTRNPQIRLAGSGEGLKFLALANDFGWQKGYTRLTNEAP